MKNSQQGELEIGSHDSGRSLVDIGFVGSGGNVHLGHWTKIWRQEAPSGSASDGSNLPNKEQGLGCVRSQKSSNFPLQERSSLLVEYKFPSFYNQAYSACERQENVTEG